MGEKDRNRERERSFDNHEVTEDDDDVFDLFFQKQQRMVSTTPCRVTAPLGARAPALMASTLPPLSVRESLLEMCWRERVCVCVCKKSSHGRTCTVSPPPCGHIKILKIHSWSYLPAPSFSLGLVAVMRGKWRLGKVANVDQTKFCK